MSIDVEKLLFLIEARPALYNYTDKDYTNRIIIENLWLEIAKEMNCEVSECRTKWTNLRNSYTRYLREEKNNPSGPGGRQKKKWHFYDAMSFLKNYIKHNHNPGSSADIPGNILVKEETSYTETSYNDLSPNIQHESTQTTTTFARYSPLSFNTPKTSVTEMVAGPLIEFLQSRIREESSENGNVLFFKSMLADYEKLSSGGQRTFRAYMLNKMNELLEAEENVLKYKRENSES